MSWRPTASIETLHKRAELIAKLRHFFTERGVLEVETPLMLPTTVTDRYIMSIPTYFKRIGAVKEEAYYLQTSPEYAMKRLLAAEAGSIYQISKAFRQGEIGRFHNPEFTLLEWYRLGFDHHALMDEMDELLRFVFSMPPAERASCTQVFTHSVGIDPHQASVAELAACAKKCNIPYENAEETERNFWLDLLFTHCIEPQLGKERPFFLYDFPVSQAALAKIRQENPPVASRFELYYQGVELANGFHELQDAKEQRSRFEQDLAYRAQHGIAAVPVDEDFLSALEQGLPDCAGVALGIDRLMMLVLQCEKITDVLSFGFKK